MTDSEKKCDIPSRTLGPCDKEWGHDGDMHGSCGDGFYAQDHLKEHIRRQYARKGGYYVALGPQGGIVAGDSSRERTKDLAIIAGVSAPTVVMRSQLKIAKADDEA